MMDIVSIMADTNQGLNQRIAARVRGLRSSLRLSLDALEQLSGVSRSMISLVERGESSPTAVVLEKLASGLGVALPELFDPPSGVKCAATGPVSRRRDQTEWKDPASGYVRRDVSPYGVPQPMRIVEVRFPAGQRVAFDNARRDAHLHQQIWILAGSLNVTVGRKRHTLNLGDCLAMRLDQPVMFHNPTRKATRYAVVLASEFPARR